MICLDFHLHPFLARALSHLKSSLGTWKKKKTLGSFPEHRVLQLSTGLGLGFCPNLPNSWYRKTGNGQVWASSPDPASLLHCLPGTHCSLSQQITCQSPEALQRATWRSVRRIDHVICRKEPSRNFKTVWAPKEKHSISTMREFRKWPVGLGVAGACLCYKYVRDARRLQN